MSSSSTDKDLYRLFWRVCDGVASDQEVEWVGQAVVVDQ